MRYDGKYADQFRDLAIQTNNNKFSDGSVTISQGNTVVHVTVRLQIKTHEVDEENRKVVLLYPGSASRDQVNISEKKMRMTEGLSKIMQTCLLLPQTKKALVDIIVQQDDGSLYSTCVNGLYLALQQAVDHQSMKDVSEKVTLTHTFAAATYVSLPDGTYALDPDTKEEEMATFLADITMTESGEFIDLIVNNKRSPFLVDRLNEVMVIGKSAIENRLGRLSESLYSDATLEIEDKTIVIATGNVGKAREFEALFKTQGYKIKTLKDFEGLPDVAETGTTFSENAKLKAETIATILKMPVLADDSGLKVDALGGLPGVYSARFAGTQKSDAANNAKLMHELTDVPDEKRTAQFHCTLAFASPNKETLVVEAEWPGWIGRIPRGENGFGYDPLFIVDESGKTSAQLLPEEKNELSHRGKAIQKLALVWKDWLEGDR